MVSLQVDMSNNITLTNGQLTAISESEKVLQKVRIRLRSFKDEWYLDPNRAPDWFGMVLTHPFRPSWARRELSKNILEVPGVVSIKTLTLTPNNDTQEVEVFVEYRDIYTAGLQSVSVTV